MRTLVGIDEAGYGPTLGPLVLGVVVLRCPQASPGDPWTLLRRVVARKPDARGQKLAVDDSKKLLGAGRSLGLLEATALSVLGDGDAVPPALESLLPENFVWPEWYRERERGDAAHLPEDARGDTVLRLRRKLTAELATAGATLEVSAHPILEGEFNRAVERRGNKASAHVDFVAEQLARVLEGPADGPFEIRVDRLGGRRYYEGLIAALVPFAPLEILAESAERSSYRIQHRGRPVEFHFEVESDSQHFPVALASVCAKYVRELFVRRLNRWFLARRPGLRPTAGYPEDARRFLAEVEDLLTQEQRAALVRVR